MSENVQFDMDEQGMPSRPRSPGSLNSPVGFGQSQVPGMAAWLVRKGIIKNESAAKGALIAIVIGDFAIAALILYFFVLK